MISLEKHTLGESHLPLSQAPPTPRESEGEGLARLSTIGSSTLAEIFCREKCNFLSALLYYKIIRLLKIQ